MRFCKFAFLAILFCLTQLCEDGFCQPPNPVDVGDVSIVCGKTTNVDFCAPEPNNCGTIFCTRPAPVWIVNPDDECEKIPRYDWLCTADSKEPVNYYSGSLENCIPDTSTTTGLKGYVTAWKEVKVCWEWRYCGAGCTESSASDGTITTRGSGRCGGDFVGRVIQLRRAKCDGGAGNGDAELGNWEDFQCFCNGVKLDCYP